MKTKKKKRKRAKQSKSDELPADTTHTEHIDLATGIQDSVIKEIVYRSSFCISIQTETTEKSTYCDL